ncbi:type II secretion system F family protein [Paenibacillus sp. N1-5-1-14]|uniref:type II secretion system F family protein n=1 Tax=Paenibacillus radicibacter TaxID=2972488 RepID=UPI00215963E7|nr:type II secretion system F family protein [Paenibacillus radicibacter]MCR8641577.1 type II secretion system F family protein [Paenibacillus radicibacter]
MIWLIVIGVIGGSFLAFSVWDRLKARKISMKSAQDIPIQMESKVRFAKTTSEVPVMKTSRSIVYDNYVLSKKERFTVVLIAALIAGGIGFVFYKNVIVAILFACSGLLFPKIWRKTQITRRKDKLLLQFKQALYCLSSSLNSGKSIENAFSDALSDLRMLYMDSSTLIIVEFENIVNRMENGEPMERAIADFADRANIDDITNFSDVLITCKRTGGNLMEVMRRTASILGDKLEIQIDIAVMISQKKFESRVLMGAPVAIVGVLSLTSPDYMEPLFQGVKGPIIMTICLLVLGLCFWLSQKIMRIQV